MPAAKLLLLIAVFFLTSLVSVVTGSTSLITIPVLVALGVETHVAVATNMLALTFLSAGGSIPFMGKGIINRRMLPLALVLTVVGSTLGALLMLHLPARAVQLTLVAAMIGAIVLTLMRPDFGSRATASRVSVPTQAAGYSATFLLAIYGGSISGGYATMLTGAFVFFFGMTLLESVATTKVVNFFSSGVATLVFFWRGAVNWKLGIILGIVTFVGAALGSRFSMKLSSLWLRRIFVTALLGMAIKMVWAAMAH
ncbi:MAG: sulfite exporter TauE/SafE family protein [Terriglobales bacterium]